MLPGDGTDLVYAEQGSNHIILTSDGARDQIYGCDGQLDAFVADGSPTRAVVLQPQQPQRESRVG